MSSSPFAPLDTSSPSSSSSNPRRVAYYYDPDVGNYVYYLGHPMKPHRIRMAHNLIVNYGLADEESFDAPESSGEGSRLLNANGGMEGVDGTPGGMEVDGMDAAEKRYEQQTLTGSRGRAMQAFRPKRATKLDMTKFHTDEYIDLLEHVNPDNAEVLTGNGTRCLTGEDCPPFEGLFEFCSISAGGSIAAAHRLNSGAADIAINWAGGLHHAKKTEASGFCYVNDIVLGILELLRIHPRVLYIDVDVHHGDGVEEAFYTTDRVMTASFHRFGEFFPGTGDVRDVGMKRGKGYAVNVPLRDGITDEAFHSIFKPVIRHIIDFYRPGAIVLQMGADSLSGDKLGGFNMTLHGHAECAKFVKSFNLPVMMLGGGGYTTKNVARAWTYETAVMCGRELSEDLPYNQYMEYYGPRYKLEVLANNQDNHNPPEYLESIKNRVLENLRNLPHAPGAQMQPVKRGVASLLGMDEASDPEDEVEARIRKIMRKRQLNGNAGYSSGSDSDGEEPVGRQRGYVNPSGGRRGVSKRREGEDDDDDEFEDVCGVLHRKGKRTFFAKGVLPRLDAVINGIGKTAPVPAGGVGAGGAIGNGNGNGSGNATTSGPAVPVMNGNGVVEGWNASRGGSPMSVV